MQIAARWGLAHGAGAGAAGLALGLISGLGPVYLAPALVATALLLWQGAVLASRPTVRSAWRLFHTSNGYLALTLLAICLAVALHVGR